MEITSQVPPGLNQEDPDSTSYDTLEITSLPSTVSEEYLELYFNSPRSGGCDDAVKNIVMIQPGMAHVHFHDPKGNKTHVPPCCYLLLHLYFMKHSTYNILYTLS